MILPNYSGNVFTVALQIVRQNDLYCYFAVGISFCCAVCYINMVATAETAVLIAVGYRDWALGHMLAGACRVNLPFHALLIPWSQIVCFASSFAESWPVGFERPLAVCALPQCSQSECVDKVAESVESSPKLRCQPAAR